MPNNGSARDSTVKGRERNALSVVQLYRMLSSLADGKKPIPEPIVHACGKQERLAALSIGDKGIQGMSLNTLKKAARATAINGADGWEELEKVRLKVWRLGQMQRGRQRAVATKRKVSTADKLRDTAVLLEQSIRARASLMRAYSELLTIVRQAAKGDSATAQRMKRHLITFGDLGFRSVPEDQANG